MNNIFEQLKLNPDNPRTITKEQFASLKRSLKSFSKMLLVRPVVYDENFVILGGNMRLTALRELVKEGFEIKDEYFASAKDWTETEKKEFVIKDNLFFGNWNWDELANKWDLGKLKEWGMDMKKLEEDDFYSRNITSPIYEPSKWKPDVKLLVDKSKVEKLVIDIDKADISDEDKEFLQLASMRHLVFDYSKVADYYANSSPAVKKLMEDSALVIIDYKRAIELGYVDLTKGIAKSFKKDHGE